tara:strand:- start:285 stop:653 length:369 start_codon:yes stop_codon:yes gene_type:complete
MKNNKLNRYINKTKPLNNSKDNDNKISNKKTESLESTSQNNGIVNSIFGSIVQGAALGTGSQLAGRAIDSLIGPKKIEINNSEKCNNEIELYTKCINDNNDLTLCKDYFELLTKCRKNNINI